MLSHDLIMLCPNVIHLVLTCLCAAAAIAARGTYTDMDILEFLTNVECLEGLFDTYGTFGRGFNGDLEMGGPIPMGAQKANLSYEIQSHMEEVALNEQASSLAPCSGFEVSWASGHDEQRLHHFAHASAAILDWQYGSGGVFSVMPKS